MGTLYQRGDSKVWWVSYSDHGRRYRESTGTESKTKARAILAKREAAIFEGTFFPEKRRTHMTVEELGARWLEHAKRKKSLAADARRFELLAELLGPKAQIAGLTTPDVERLIERLQERETRLGTPMKPSSINRHLALLKSALRLAAREGYLHRDPMAGVKLLPEHNERDRICTPEEYKRLTEAAPPWLRLAIVIAYHTGMRAGEIVSLTWGQVDLGRRLITLRSTDTKTGEGRRVPLAEAVVEALRAEPRTLGDSRVFVAVRGTLSPSFSKLTRELGIEDLHFHDLRHTAATHLRRAGADVFTIAAITGHKDLKTLRRYQTITDEDLRAAVDAVGVKR